MKKWEIYRVDLPNFGPHFVAIISSNRVCDDQSIKAVNALLCSTVRLGDRIAELEVGLHDAEGFEFVTGCQCHAFLTVAKTRFEGVALRGTVSMVRREEIKRKIRAAFDL